MIPVRMREDRDVYVFHFVLIEPRFQAIRRLSALEAVHEHDLSCADHRDSVTHAVVCLTLRECDMREISIKCHKLPPIKKGSH